MGHKWISPREWVLQEEGSLGFESTFCASSSYFFSMSYQNFSLCSLPLWISLHVHLSPQLPTLKFMRMASLLLTLILVFSSHNHQLEYGTIFNSLKILYIHHCPLVPRMIFSSNLLNLSLWCKKKKSTYWSTRRKNLFPGNGGWSHQWHLIYLLDQSI